MRGSSRVVAMEKLLTEKCFGKPKQGGVRAAGYDRDSGQGGTASLDGGLSFRAGSFLDCRA
jgi:hypothetical protein